VRRRLLEAARSLALETADPLLCDLLANLHLHLEHEADLDMVVEIRRSSAAAVMSLAEAIEQALPALGRLDARHPSCRLLFGGSLVADRPPAAGADRRLRGGTGGPARPEARFRLRTHPAPNRYLRRPQLLQVIAPKVTTATLRRAPIT
jgi:hypothetical protein